MTLTTFVGSAGNPFPMTFNIDYCLPNIKAKEPTTPPWIDAEVTHLPKNKESASR